MFDDSDFTLRWPADLLADELEANAATQDHGNTGLGKLLDEAFEGDAILERVRAGEFESHRPETIGLDVNAWRIKSFRDRLIKTAGNGQLASATALAPRWRQRNGLEEPTPARTTEAGAALRRDFSSLIQQLDSDGYFDKVAPQICIDDHDQHGYPLSQAVEQQLGILLDLSVLRRSNEPAAPNLPDRLWTELARTSIDDLEDDELYELVEILHDFAARPRHASWHDYGPCGWHYSTFAIEPGRRLYRYKVNQLLDRLGINLRLETEGELTGRLVRTTDDAREQLLVDARASAAPDDEKTVDHAIALFSRHGATYEDKRSAVIALAGILEPMRNTVLKTELKGAEGDLFNIANNFHLRHNTPNQKKGYSEAFLDWLFWWYLATVEMAQSVINANP